MTTCTPNTPRHAFHIMTKPNGPLCNLNCKYCYYLEKQRLRPADAVWRMTPEVLDAYIRQYIASQATPEVTFAWQGGEPTLLGVDFFREAVALQRKYADERPISNTFQTNGILLDTEWCNFFREHAFLVGVSIDGPETLHNCYRLDKGGRPTFRRVIRGIERLQQHGVDFNTLTCVHAGNQDHPLEVYRFLKHAGSRFMQFIPIVECNALRQSNGTPLAARESLEALVTQSSVHPLTYGKFLTAVFDEWVREDVGRYFIQIVDATLPVWLGMDPMLCVFSRECGNALAIESNGDVYPCDHFVYPEHRLGNILERDLAELAGSARQLNFGLKKASGLPEYCHACEFVSACNGECPKHRFLTAPNGEPGLNYLCEGYKHFFAHVSPYMHYMARLIAAGHPATGVMRMARLRDLSA